MNKKLVIGIGILILIVIGWFAFQGSGSVEYVSTIDDEVTQIEEELMELQAAIDAGELTSEEAAEAQVRISQRLEAINTAVESSEKTSLSPSQKAQLLGGLDRLKNVLTNYRTTLATVDAAVLKLPVAERPILNPRGSKSPGRRSIVAALEEMVEAVEDHVEEVVEDYVPEEDEEMDDSTITEEGADDSSTTSEDGTGEGTSGEDDEESSGQSEASEGEMSAEEPSEEMSEGEEESGSATEDAGESTTTIEEEPTI